MAVLLPLSARPARRAPELPAQPPVDAAHVLQPIEARGQTHRDELGPDEFLVGPEQRGRVDGGGFVQVDGDTASGQIVESAAEPGLGDRVQDLERVETGDVVIAAQRAVLAGRPIEVSRLLVARTLGVVVLPSGQLRQNQARTACGQPFQDVQCQGLVDRARLPVVAVVVVGPVGPGEGARCRSGEVCGVVDRQVVEGWTRGGLSGGGTVSPRRSAGLGRVLSCLALAGVGRGLLVRSRALGVLHLARRKGRVLPGQDTGVVAGQQFHRVAVEPVGVRVAVELDVVVAFDLIGRHVVGAQGHPVRRSGAGGGVALGPLHVSGVFEEGGVDAPGSHPRKVDAQPHPCADSETERVLLAQVRLGRLRRDVHPRVVVGLHRVAPACVVGGYRPHGHDPPRARDVGEIDRYGAAGHTGQAVA